MATSETAVVRRTAESVPSISAFEGNGEAFNTVVRMARGLAASSIVPEAYRNNESNVMVALEYAHRLGASVLAVMQHLYIVKGKPSLSASFLIGTVNASGRFSPIRFKWEGTAGKDDWGCRAVATDLQSGEECVGPLINIALAKKDGWYSKKDKNGNETSKWQVFPEMMLMYRAGAWWTRVYCPELSLGLHSSEEMEDYVATEPQARTRSIAAALDAGDAPPAPAQLSAGNQVDAEQPDLIDA